MISLLINLSISLYLTKPAEYLQYVYLGIFNYIKYKFAYFPAV